MSHMPRVGKCPHGIEYEECDECRTPQSSLAAPAGSTPTQQCAQEMWDTFMRHNLSYEQCINVMVATTKMIGRKACDDEVGAFCMFLHQAMKICPELGDVAKATPDSTTAKP